jgi:hypothetical protein
VSAIRRTSGTDCPPSSCSGLGRTGHQSRFFCDQRPALSCRHLLGRTSDRTISMMSSSPEAVGSSLFQSTPSPIYKSTPLALFNSNPWFGRSCVHSGTKPMPRPAETSEKVSSQVKVTLSVRSCSSNFSAI